MNLYRKLGIDPGKQNVREIFSKLNHQEYPGAFVNIITDPYEKSRVMTQHQDGDGSKLIQRFLHFFESQDPSIFPCMVDDALSMNTGDIAAAGFVFGPLLVTDVLNLNCHKSLKETVMKAVALRFLELRELYRSKGFKIDFLGGETADLPDQVRRAVFDVTVTSWADRKDLILGNVQVGDIIFGFPSDGLAAWEKIPNSGIMSNGLTLARRCLLSERYNKKYPDLKRDQHFYKGRFEYDSTPAILHGESISGALLSPTRQWAIVIREIITCLKKVKSLHMLHGITMNTGGGATKITNLGKGGIMFVKDMPTPPPLFHLIQTESNASWKDMYQTFNCGVGIDVIGADNPIFANALKQAALNCELPLYRLGTCRTRFEDTRRRGQLKLETPYGTFEY